jgi:hypothetical protein
MTPQLKAINVKDVLGVHEPKDVLGVHEPKRSHLAGCWQASVLDRPTDPLWTPYLS